MLTTPRERERERCSADHPFPSAERRVEGGWTEKPVPEMCESICMEEEGRRRSTYVYKPMFLQG
jgi:hypothetical protein